MVWNQLIPWLIGMAIGSVISLYFQGKMGILGYAINNKFTVFSIIFGTIIGTAIGHVLYCDKRE